MSKRCLIVVNPISGRSLGRRKAPRLARGLRDRGFDVETVATRGRGDARRAVEQVAADGPSAILCVGGDGTLNEVINGLGETDIPVAVFPAGTGNVLAKEFGIRPRVAAVCDAIAGGRTMGLTLGEANGRRFGLFVGGGFDAAVVERFEKRRTGGASKLSYLIPIVKALAAYRFPEMRVTVDGEPAGTASNVLVTNTRSYGGPFELVPDADPTDAVFDVCLVSGVRRLDLVRHTWAAFRRRLLDCRDVRRVRGRRIEIHAGGAVPFQVDGDSLGRGDLSIRMLDTRLSVLVP